MLRLVIKAALVGMVASGAAGAGAELQAHEDVEPWYKQEPIEWEVHPKGKQPVGAWEDAFEGLGDFEFLQQYAEADPEPASENTQRVAPKRLECSCTFQKVNTLAEPKSGYHVGTLDSSTKSAAPGGGRDLAPQSAPSGAGAFVEENTAGKDSARQQQQQQQQQQKSGDASRFTEAPSSGGIRGGRGREEARRQADARRFVRRFAAAEADDEGTDPGLPARRSRVHRRSREWVERPEPVDDFVEEDERLRGGGGAEEEEDEEVPMRRQHYRPRRSRHSRRTADEEEDDEDVYARRDRGPRLHRRRSVGRQRYRGGGEGGGDDDDYDHDALMETEQRYPVDEADWGEEAPQRGHRRHAHRHRRRLHRDPYAHESEWEEGEFRHYDGYEPRR